MQFTAVIFTALLGLLTFTPLLPSNHWSVRVWEFPRLQIVGLIGLNILFIAAFLITMSFVFWLLLLINLVLLVYQLRWILPYTPLVKVKVKRALQPKSERCIRIVTANVLMTNRQAEKLIRIVTEHRPDILVTLESNQWWQEALESLHDTYLHRVNRPLENLYGMHVYSRLPLSEVQITDLVEDDVPSIHCLAALECGQLVECHFLHPAPPSPTENEESTERDHELIGVARTVVDSQFPVIVTGDLNDVAWSPTTRLFRKISGLEDPRIGRGAFNTFHTKYAFARWPLDHLFHSDDFELVKLARLADFGSDHFPLLTELALKELT